jgi:hypothetical protein
MMGWSGEKKGKIFRYKKPGKKGWKKGIQERLLSIQRLILSI